MNRTHLLIVFLLATFTACNGTLTVTVDSHEGMNEDFARYMAESTLKEAGITHGTYHATAEEKRVSEDAVRLSLCISGSGFKGKACEGKSWLKNDYADGTIVGSIWTEHELAEKIKYRVSGVLGR